jgi:hypothetical protein
MTKKEIEKLTYNQRLERVGIKTITIKNDRGEEIKYLLYNGVQIPRPDVSKVETTVKEKFKIDM